MSWIKKKRKKKENNRTSATQLQISATVDRMVGGKPTNHQQLRWNYYTTHARGLSRRE